MEDVVNGHLGKVIVQIEMSDDTLTIRFGDGTGLKLYDDGQDCCETRYMHTDDDLSEVVGGRLYGIELRDAPDGEDEYGEVHEIQFLVVKTGIGEVVVCTHNEHNGYYGGFRIVACTVN
jgi:hypothetical protein